VSQRQAARYARTPGPRGASPERRNPPRVRERGHLLGGAILWSRARSPSSPSVTGGQPITVKPPGTCIAKTTLTVIFPRFDPAPIGKDGQD